MSLALPSWYRSRLAPNLVVSILSVSLLTGAALAGTDAPDADTAPKPFESPVEYGKHVWNRDTLAGDWFGARQKLIDHGIMPKMRMTHYYQESTSGGIRDHGEYGGKMDYNVLVDGEKAAGTWPGFYIALHAETRWGDDIGRHVGVFNLPNAQMLWPKSGDYSGSQITGLIVQQYLTKTAVVFAGKLNTLDIIGIIYPELGIGQEGFMNVNSLVTAWPWFRFVNLVMYGGGGWLTDDQGRVTLGLIAFGQENVSTTWEIDESFENGVGFLAFGRKFWKVAGLEGSASLFIGGATRQYRSSEDTDWSELLSTPNEVFLGLNPGDRDRRPWAIAPYLSQELWVGGDGQKVTLFTGGSVAREDPSFANWHAFGALEGFGVIPSREGDRMGFAASYNNVPKEFKDNADLIGVGIRDHYSFEWYYNLEVTKWLHVTANFQLLQNAFKGDNMAVVPGLRTTIDF